MSTNKASVPLDVWDVLALHSISAVLLDNVWNVSIVIPLGVQMKLSDTVPASPKPMANVSSPKGRRVLPPTLPPPLSTGLLEQPEGPRLRRKMDTAVLQIEAALDVAQAQLDRAREILNWLRPTARRPRR